MGNSGSGKSCAVARLIQNIFSNQIKPKTNIFIFDVFGEYNNALSNYNGLKFTSYTTNINDKTSSLVKIPIWLLGIEDLALLLEIESYTQLPIIEKMLRVVTIFSLLFLWFPASS